MTVNNPQSYPQPYGQQSFGQQQSGQMGIETLNMSDALSIAWNHFTRQWVPWVLSMQSHSTCGAMSWAWLGIWTCAMGTPFRGGGRMGFQAAFGAARLYGGA